MTKKCPACKSQIPYTASVCPQCTSSLVTVNDTSFMGRIMGIFQGAFGAAILGVIIAFFSDGNAYVWGICLGVLGGIGGYYSGYQHEVGQ